MSERRFERRSTARVVLVDHDDRVLLFRDSDRGLPGLHWWITPGGGIEEGESEREAAAREVQEETGLVLAAEAFVGPLARRTVWHGYSDKVQEQQDVFFGVVVEHFEVDTAGQTEEELVDFVEHRWWPREEMEALELGQEEVWPARLLEIWDVLTSSREPLDHLDPLDLGVEEESTVPVDQR